MRAIGPDPREFGVVDIKSGRDCARSEDHEPIGTAVLGVRAREPWRPVPLAIGVRRRDLIGRPFLGGRELALDLELNPLIDREIAQGLAAGPYFLLRSRRDDGTHNRRPAGTDLDRNMGVLAGLEIQAELAAFELGHVQCGQPRFEVRAKGLWSQRVVDELETVRAAGSGFVGYREFGLAAIDRRDA